MFDAAEEVMPMSESREGAERSPRPVNEGADKNAQGGKTRVRREFPHVWLYDDVKMR